MATWSEDLFSIIQMARSSSQTGMKACPKNPFGWELQSQKPRESLLPHFGVQAAGSWNFILTKSTRQNKDVLAAVLGGENVEWIAEEELDTYQDLKITDKLMDYLGIADIDYLSARLLFMSGFPIVAMAKAAEALEKLFKILIVMITRIYSQVELTDDQLKKDYGHDLGKLLKGYNKIAPESVRLIGDTTILDNLRKAYNLRYTGRDKEINLEFSLEEFDKWYVLLRNLIVRNTPKELAIEVRQFGTFHGKLYEAGMEKILSQYRTLRPGDILRYQNAMFDKLDVDLQCPLCQYRSGEIREPTLDDRT
ncbi:MAG TPA: hypothetical protein PLI75_04240 [Anaerolineales bacterium]|nr:hypothetical protein [Anaerolineales bacterium]